MKTVKILILKIILQGGMTKSFTIIIIKSLVVLLKILL